jgi:photosystem II stability/assembly factor-like uncharacterized protein
MTPIIIPAIRRFRISFLLLAILSCDSFKEDFIELENQVTFSQTEFYTMPGSSVIIDQKSIIEKSFSNASLIISQKPTLGEISSLDSLLLKYKPGPDFTAGKDQFVFSVFSGGKVLATQTITIYMKQREDFPCALYSVEDRVKVKNASSISIRVLENDLLCGTNGSGMKVSIYSNPRFGECRVEGDSIIVYTSGSAFKGRDEMVYKLTASDGGDSSYGIITIDVGILEIPNYAKKISYVSNFLFLDDNTGFLLAGDSLYKTTDGAENWNKVLFPPNQGRHITNVFFLDINNGFASFNAGPLMRTTDGGVSWSLISTQNLFQHYANSVYFTSSSVGFVSTSHMTVPWDSIQHHIYKTVDGGVNWKEVFTTPDEIDGFLQIETVNSTTGYAYKRDKVFITNDAGESWNLLFKDDYIKFFRVAPENEIFATFGQRPSTLLKSKDGLTWQMVSYYGFHESAILAFAPSVDIWFAAGLDSYNHSLDFSLQIFNVRKSVDYGSTWTRVGSGETFQGFPIGIAVPSGNVAYILCSDKVLKFTNP